MSTENLHPDLVGLRRAGPQDAAALSDIGTTTFVETFGHLYSPEDLGPFLAKTYALEASQALLADTGVGVWFASTANAPPAAFVVAGPCKLPVLALEPTAGEVRLLYVRSAFQKQRLGAQLLETALEWLSAQHRTPVYVGVWSENFGAQRFYARYGFGKVGEYYFPVGNTRDLEFILKR
jgi:ribosomal protein S18 acetylase RimI-like enzyme